MYMPGWKTVSDDPNNPKLLALRARMVDDAFGGFVPDRVAHMSALATSKRVLDVGVVDHLAQNKKTKGAAWLHGAIAAAAADCIGIDVLESEVAVLRDQGFNVIVADATTADFDHPFDVIVAGEIIEHLDNPGGLMTMAKRNLGRDGVFVLSTPNPYFVERVWKNWRAKPTDSADHVSLFWPSGIIEMAERAGLRLLAWHPVEISRSPGAFRAKVFVRLNWLWSLLHMSPLYRADTVIYELKHSIDPHDQA